PILIDIVVNGRPVKAVVQLTKQAMAYVLDRETGKPVWPIEERAVPKSNTPGERTAATQPFPTRPAPFDLHGITTNDLIDFTPEPRSGGRPTGTADHQAAVRPRDGDQHEYRRARVGCRECRRSARPSRAEGSEPAGAWSTEPRHAAPDQDAVLPQSGRSADDP